MKHAHHQMHDNSLEAYYLYHDTHLSLEERCYHYIRAFPNCTDEEVAKGVLGKDAHRQGVAPRINSLLKYGEPDYVGNKSHLAVRESGKRYVKKGKYKLPVRTLEIVPVQMRLAV